MFLEADELAVSAADLDAARAGDEAAIKRLRQRLDGVEIYMHAFSDEDGDVHVSLRDLVQLRVVEYCTVHCRP